MSEEKDQAKVRTLVQAIDQAFPQTGKAFNSAVFFHHDKDGKLITCSPLVTGGSEEFTVALLIKRLYVYADACKEMADELVKRNLEKN
jgi:hypothetical protein